MHIKKETDARSKGPASKADGTTMVPVHAGIAERTLTVVIVDSSVNLPNEKANVAVKLPWIIHLVGRLTKCSWGIRCSGRAR